MSYVFLSPLSQHARVVCVCVCVCGDSTVFSSWLKPGYEAGIVSRPIFTSPRTYSYPVRILRRRLCQNRQVLCNMFRLKFGSTSGGGDYDGVVIDQAGWVRSQRVRSRRERYCGSWMQLFQTNLLQGSNVAGTCFAACLSGVYRVSFRQYTPYPSPGFFSCSRKTQSSQMPNRKLPHGSLENLGILESDFPYLLGT
jgi:hypothetical protein